MGALRLKDGTRVPGATTIVGILDKPFLVPWANKLGMQKIDVQEYTQKQALLGTLMHEILESHILRESVVLGSQYSDDDIDKIAKLFQELYLPWEANHKLEPIFIEKELVSEVYKYGGIIDMYCILDGKKTLVDFKTSKQISKEQLLQLSSYYQLLTENGYEVEQMMILDVPKFQDKKLQTHYLDIEVDVPKYFKLFKDLVNVYYDMKEIGFEKQLESQPVK